MDPYLEFVPSQPFFQYKKHELRFTSASHEVCDCCIYEFCQKLSDAKKLHSDKIDHYRGLLWSYAFPQHIWYIMHFSLAENEYRLVNILAQLGKKMLFDRDPTSEGSYILSFRTMSLVLQQHVNHGNADDEVQLYNDLSAWALKLEDVHPDYGDFRNTMRPLMKYIRFGVMPLESFESLPLKDRIFTRNEEMAIREFVLDRAGAPPIISSIASAGTLCDSFYVHHVRRRDATDQFVLCKTTHDMLSCATLSINDETTDRAIVEFAQVNAQVCRFASTYSEKITLVVVIPELGKVVRRIDVKRIIAFNTSFIVPLGKPLNLKKYNNMTVKVKVIFHRSGFYPFGRKVDLNLIERKRGQSVVCYNDEQNTFIYLLGYQ